MKLTYILRSNRNLDIVVLGATGFTGRHIVERLSQILTSSQYGLKWGIAGRKRESLENVISETSVRNRIDLTSVPLIEVDINDAKSLTSMCGSSRMVINACGPYRFLGEPVVKACIDSNTHHIDVSGEPEFLETIQLKYDQKAKQSNVCIVGSCGFDSIPCDTGVQYLKHNFNGTLNSVETFLKVKSGSDGAIANFATWDSLVNGYANRHQLSQLRKQLYSKFFKKYEWKHSIERKSVFTNQLGICVPFPGSDRSVVNRTQMYNYTNFSERPTQIETYFTITTLKALFGLFFANLTVNMLAKHNGGKKLLLNYPHIFSNGVFRKKSQPSREDLLENRFQLVLIGHGWHQKHAEPDFQPMEKPDKTLICKISGGDLAYLDTSKMVSHSAITLLQLLNDKKLPFGVLTPSVAFSNSQLIDNLIKSGINFEIIEHL